MTPEEALKKAEEGWELGIIPFEKIDEYAAHLLKNSINNNVINNIKGGDQSELVKR